MSSIAGLNNYGLKKPAENINTDEAESQNLLSEVQISTQENKKPVERSPLAEILIKSQVSDYSFSQNSSKMIFNSKNGDIYLHSTSDLNISNHTEYIDLEITLAAEALDIDPSIFKENGNQPLQLEFSFLSTRQRIETHSYLSVEKTTRTPQEVIGNLAKALYSVIKEPGNKTVGVTLDLEAVQALLGDEKTAALLDEIVALLGIINSLRNMEEESNHYQVFVSGKGPVKINYSQSADIRTENLSINLKININPPQSKNENSEVLTNV